MTRRLAHLSLTLAMVAAPALADVRPDPDLTKNATAFKRAFDPVVEKAGLATVDVSCDGRRAALGTIVSADGYILSKASELRGALTVRTKAAPGKAAVDFVAKIVGVAPDDDLALLKVEARDLPVIEWADAAAMKKVEVGDWVAAAGTQSDRPVNVGIISVNRRKIPARAGVLGVSLADDTGSHGAKVQQVLPDSGAEKAGVKVDDVITAVDGKPVRTRAELIDAVRTMRPGDRVTLKITRAGKEIELSAVLGATFNGLSPRLDMQNVMLGPVSKRASAFPAVLQHDTVIKPTDCGGPLVNLDGKAIGLNIARAGRTETYALPADVVVPLINDLKAGKFAPATAPATKPDAPATTSAPATRKADAATRPAPLK